MEPIDPEVDMFGCPAALLLPVEMTVDRSVTPPTIGYRSVDTGRAVRIEWSWGVSAFELDGTVRIVAPDGEVLLSEGAVADDLGGAPGEGDVFGVCVPSSLPRRPGSP